MPATMGRISSALESAAWTPGEKEVIRWQFGLHTSGFRQSLWEAIRSADVQNLNLLAKAFPAEVEAFCEWSTGDLGERLRNWGLGI